MKAFLRESIELRLSFSEAKALIAWLSDNSDDPTRDRAAISLSVDDWQFPSESVEETFGLRVNGGEIWTGTGAKFDSTVQASVPAEDQALAALIDRLMHGTALDVESAKGTPITHFSLDRAAATLENHFECETRFAG